MSPRRRKLVKWLAITGGSCVLLLGLLLAAFQLAVARVPEYRVQLQDWLSERTGLVIEFSRISARLRLFGPELVFRDAIVRSPDRTIVLATARRGSVGFDLWTSLGAGRLTAGRFSLTTPEIGLIRTRSGGIQLVGQSALPDRATRPFAIEQLPIGRFQVTNALVSFRDEATGRGPWALSGVSFVLDRQPALLELRGDAALPTALGQSLEFSARAEGALEQSANVFTTLRLEGKKLDLAGWADVLPDEWPAPETGHGAVLLTAAFRGAELSTASAKVDFGNVAAVAPVWTTPLPVAAPLQMKPDEPEGAVAPAPAPEPTPEAAASPEIGAELLSYSRIAFTLSAKRAGEDWQLAAKDVDLVRGDEAWHAADIGAQWSKDEAGGLKLEANADHLSLQTLWPLLAYLPESEGLAHVRALRASGSVDKLTLKFERTAADQPPQYSLQAGITAAAFAPVARTPGLTGITGQLTATQEGGELQLASRDMRFDLPRMFRQPLDVQTLSGVLRWERAPAGWMLKSEDLQVTTPDGRATATFALMLPADPDISPVMELKAQARDMNAAATPKYLPADKLSPKALEWLDHAFPTGRVPEGEVIYRGPTRAFPFRRGEGEFVARARVEDLTFNYQAGWQPATGMVAQVEFHNQGMRLRSGTAALGDLRITRMTGEFADFRAGNVAIDADAAGDLGHALKFLQTSPVSEALGSLFQRLDGEGATESRVTLLLPLKHVADRKLTVATRLQDATVTMDGVAGPVTQLSGTLNIKQSLPESAQLQGQWLGGPLSVNVQPQGPNRSMLSAQGTAGADKLTALLHLPGAVKINGTLPWQLHSQLAAAPGVRLAQKFTIDSPLTGLELDLPDPVGKAADATRPLRVDIEFVGDDAVLTRASLGDVRALVRLRQSANGWNLDRGGVRADAIAAALPDHRGIRIEGSIDTLVLDDWLALRGSTGSGPTSAGTSGARAAKLADFLNAASLKVGTLQVFGYQFLDVRGMLQAVNAGWKLDVSGPNAEGSLQIPDDFTGAQPLSLSMQRLIVTSLDKPKAESQGRELQASRNDPRTWPALRGFVANLKVDTHSIGTVDLRTSRVENGMQIDVLTVVQDALQGEFTGNWLVMPEGERSSLQARISSTDVGATLRALNYTQFLDAKRGEMTADLNWPGGFDSDFLGKASGSLTVKAENGQLLNVQPGAGRVLGLLSVGALKRRLSLDFSDLTDKGLSFDTVHGDFDLRNGDAYTTNLLLRGPAAEIGIVGRTGLGAHDYDQTAVVTGNLGATLPVAGALAGGPVVGAALLLFSRVFKEPLKGIARGYYRITGPWDEPVVERVDASEVREAASTATG